MKPRFPSKITLALTAFIAIALGVPGMSQTLGTWTKGAILPVIQSEWDGVAIGDSLFAVGGEIKRTPNTDATKASDELWIYDAKADKWSQGANMPGNRNHPAVATLDGMLYVFGGYNFPCCNDYPWPYGENNAWQYNPRTNAWKTLAPLPRKMGAGLAAAFDGKIYVFAGTDSGQYHSVGTVHEYDPVANTWKARTSMRNSREHVKGVVVDSLVYIIGGHSLSGTTRVNQGSVEAYSPRSDKWYDKGTMPSPRGGIGAAYLGGKIYVFGGEGADFSLFSRVDQLDPATGQWAQQQVNQYPAGGIHGHATITYKGTAHLVAGNNPAGFNPKNYHNIFTPPEVLGCTVVGNPAFNRYATKDDGSCEAVGLARHTGKIGGSLRMLGNREIQVEGLVAGRHTVQVTDVSGRMLVHATFTGSRMVIPVAAGTDGMLLVRIEGAEGHFDRFLVPGQ